MRFISEKLQNALLVFHTRYGRYVALGAMVGLAFVLFRCSP